MKLVPLWILSLILLGACAPAPGPSDQLEVAARTVQSGALSRDGNMAVIGSVYHGGSLWQLARKERLYNWNHSAEIGSLLLDSSVSPDGEWAATVDDQSLVLWSTQTGQSHGFWRLTAEANSLALARHGNVALVGMNDGRAALYNVRGGGIYRSFEHEDAVNTVALSDDLSIVATGSEDFSATVWDAATGEAMWTRKYSEPVQTLALTPDASRLFVAAQYDRAEINDLSQGETLWQLPFHKEKQKRGLSVTAARFSDDGRYLLTGRPDGWVQLWDIDSEREVQSWQLPKRKMWQPTANAVMDVGFSQNQGRFLAIGSNGFVYTLERE